MLTDPEEDYARGSVPFLGTTIYLDSRPLIPRTETEYWVEYVIKDIPRDQPITVLDLFAGSGAIGVALLHHLPLAHVTFGELETRHFPTIQKTLQENHIDPTRAVLVATDVWSAVTGTFDYVFANPPYVSKERNTAEPSTVHEPDEALYASDDGFYFIEQTIATLPDHLTEQGCCYIEHEPFQTERIATLANTRSLKVSHHHDQYGNIRFSKLSKKNMAY